jgi:hypothetical protein
MNPHAMDNDSDDDMGNTEADAMDTLDRIEEGALWSIFALCYIET